MSYLFGVELDSDDEVIVLDAPAKEAEVLVDEVVATGLASYTSAFTAAAQSDEEEEGVARENVQALLDFAASGCDKQGGMREDTTLVPNNTSTLGPPVPNNTSHHPVCASASASASRPAVPHPNATRTSSR